MFLIEWQCIQKEVATEWAVIVVAHWEILKCWELSNDEE